MSSTARASSAHSVVPSLTFRRCSCVMLSLDGPSPVHREGPATFIGCDVGALSGEGTNGREPRQDHGEAAPLAGLALDRDDAPVHLDEPPHQREPEARALVAP